MNFKRYHVSKNLFDAETAYGVFYNNGVISGELTALTAIKNSFPAELIGQQVTISVTANAIQSNRAYIRCSIDGSNIDSNAITQGNTGTLTVTITPTSTSDKWWLTYGSGTGSNTFSNLMLNTGSTPQPYEPYSSEVWHDIPHYIHNTSTDTLTTLPAVLYPNDTTATVGLKGNIVQNGTPSPTTPIQPQSCGERTGNLFYEEYPNIDSTVRYRALNLGNGTYTLSSTVEVSQSSAGTLFFLAGNVSSGASTATNAVYKDRPITVTSTDGYVTIAYRTYTVDTPEGKQTMLNSGSTPLPYEPYGIKIPILSNSTTTPVYLGETQSTRRIKKLVLTGEEPFVQTTDYQQSARFRFMANDARRGEETYSVDTIISSHYVSATGFAPGTIIQSNGNDINLTFNMQSSTYPDLASFKSWLAQQYANGTPVTVWYVLATPTTGIVNEPIRKIGDYADTVSGITIPTIAGANSFDVLTTLKPSEVTVNYKGWHPVQSVHERDNGAWT